MLSSGSSVEKCVPRASDLEKAGKANTAKSGHLSRTTDFRQEAQLKADSLTKASAPSG